MNLSLSRSLQSPDTTTFPASDMPAIAVGNVDIKVHAVRAISMPTSTTATSGGTWRADPPVMSGRVARPVAHPSVTGRHFTGGYLMQALHGWLVRQIVLWIRRARTRKQLAGLDPRLLCDIGLTRAEAQAEIRKPFWR